MFLTYVRSSSLSGLDWCETKWYCAYNLGLPDVSGKKASLGTAAHKALELLAWRKLSEQEGDDHFHDGELEKTFWVSEVTPELAVDVAFAHYSALWESPWTEKDRKDIRRWVEAALTWGDGMFSPLNRTVVAPEQFFDFTIDRDWAAYEYALPDGQRLTGQLSVKGTVDLVCRVAPGVIELTDYKSGLRKNWEKGRPKEYSDFREDGQFLLYYYALRRLYPKEKAVLITVFYLKDGGPFTISFTDEDLDRAENLIRSFYERVRATQMPSWVKDRPSQSWKCGICQYSKTSFPGDSLSVCDRVHGDLISLGMDRVNARYGDFGKLSEYGSGGGRSGK